MQFDPKYFMDHDVVVVTFNYRLGKFLYSHSYYEITLHTHTSHTFTMRKTLQITQKCMQLLCFYASFVNVFAASLGFLNTGDELIRGSFVCL